MARVHNPHLVVSELRQDPTTGKWIVLASGRGQRPSDRPQMAPPRAPIPHWSHRCPFCNFAEFPQDADTLMLPNKRQWRVRAFPNKYPAFAPQDHARAWKVGPYAVLEGVGFHEVIVPRFHNGYLSELSSEDATITIRAWRERYRALMGKPSVAYIQIIENHGSLAGASLEHAHAQLFALPILPSDEVLDLLQGAETYFRENDACGYCDMISFEREQGGRIIFENERFLVLSPFAPRVNYEQWVIPKDHAAGFEQLSDTDLPLFTAALQHALRGIARTFHDPSYNLYLNSAPCDTEGYVCAVDAFSHFHWHVRILPRFTAWAGFELATGVEIVTANPDETAVLLRNVSPAVAQSPRPDNASRKRPRANRTSAAVKH